jgi:S-adenosylmethionine:tRNA ribosyltransferase-isomerase
VRPGRRLRPGVVVEIGPGVRAQIEGPGVRAPSPVADVAPSALRRVRLVFDELSEEAALERHGHVPLPPYIRRADAPSDRARYQTVYAREGGSVAAPTAGLHFTPGVLRALKDRGVDVRRITLEVGLATFQPVRAELVADHRMLEESYAVAPGVAKAITAAKAEGRPVSAVGTTVVRTLESAWRDGAVRSGRGATSLFITPGFAFHAVDRLLTNFHLPRSTLLMLVSAFAGYDLVMKAYREAVKERYRFFSYGDCMLIV